MKQLFTLFLTLAIITSTRAQLPLDTSYININEVDDSLSIINNTRLYIDSSAVLSLNEVLKKPFFSLDDFKQKKRLSTEQVNFKYYLRFWVKNNSPVVKSISFIPGLRFNEKVLYNLNKQPPEGITDSETDGFIKFTLAPNETSEILVSLMPLKNQTDFINPILLKPEFVQTYKTIYYGNYKVIKTIGYIFSGLLLMMMFFMFTNYISTLKKEFLYNALYSLCMFCLFSLTSYSLRNTTWIADFYISYLSFFLLVIGIFFYIRFARLFLNTAAENPLLDKVLKFGERLTLVLLAFHVYLNYFSRHYVIQAWLETGIKFSILCIGLSFIILALKKRNRLFNYLAAGNAAMVVFSAISFFLVLFKQHPVSIFEFSLLYYYIGIVLEIVIFQMGLTYKNRKELIEKTKEQERLKLEAEKASYESQIAVIKAQQEERDRISADMHDDLGAGMTAIRLYSELAKNKLQDRNMPEIEKISSSANELLNKMNAIIWSMSSSNDTLGNMIAYIRSYALEYFENTGINCNVSLPENLPNIEVEGKIRRNVFLVVKEALHNIVKHAKATEVNIILTKSANGLILSIQDNGIGINFDQLRQFSNGLINMRKRMADVNIEFSIENKNGTLLILKRSIENFNSF